MEYPTFDSLSEAMEENGDLLKQAVYCIRKRAQNMKECIRAMGKSLQKLEENTPRQIKIPNSHHWKAA